MLNIDFTFIWLCFQISFQVCKYVIKLSGSKKKKKSPQWYSYVYHHYLKNIVS